MYSAYTWVARKRSYPGLFCAGLAALLVGCAVGCGAPQDDGAVDYRGGDDGGTDGGAVDPLAQSTAPLRPLSPFELAGALTALLQDPGSNVLALQPAEIHGPAETLAGGDLTWRGARADQLETTMYDVARKAVTAGPLADCAKKADDTTCLPAFYRGFLPRAFRRPVTDQEIDVFVNVVTSLSGQTDRVSAFARSLQAVLLSPDFLYLTAFGDQARPLGRAIELTPHELASRLSFALWASLPDAALSQAADADQLRTDEQIAIQVRRMLRDEKAGRAIARFTLGWAGGVNVTGHPKSDSAWTPNLAYTSMLETQAFVADWFRADKPAFSALFDSDIGFVTSDLAAFYGLPAQSGPELRRVVGMKAANRSGLLTQASFLSTYASIAQSSPVFRGKWVVERALCQTIGPPPNDAQDKAPPRDPNGTTREFNEAIAAANGCSGCHVRMSPPGFAFEQFDAIGKYRTTENGKPVHSDTELGASGDLNGKYASAIAFSAAVGRSADVRACYTQGLFAYAIGRNPSDTDNAVLATSASLMQTDAQAALVALLSSSAFRSASPNRP